jgi:drug/metabolite transporter (DMT)-like permease
MIFLILSILLNAAIYVLFKLFRQHDVVPLDAIVINYLTCLITGLIWIFLSPSPLTDDIIAWLPYAVFLGSIFIGGFTLSAYCIRYFGMYLTTTMQKISMLITVLVAYFFFHEQITLINLVGLILAVAAIWLVNKKDKNNIGDQPKYSIWILLLPAATLLISGIVETTLYVMEALKVTHNGNIHFITTTFAIAGMMGIITRLAIRKIKPLSSFKFSTVKWGVGLGVINFASIFFLIKALGSGPGSMIVPINSIGILVLSSLIGIILFKEKFRALNMAGLLVAILSIYLISL